MITTDNMFHQMPSCGVLMNFDADILDINQHAVDYYKAKNATQILNYHTFDFVIDLQKARYLLDMIITQEVLFNQKILLRKFDKTIGCAIMHASVLSKDEKKIFVQFTEPTNNSIVYKPSNSQMLLTEVKKLTPYLNKHGQHILNKLTHKFSIINEPCEINERELVCDEKIELLLKHFPNLTDKERYLCAMLMLKLSTSEISSISGMTSNTIRVTLYRIVHKLNFSSRDALLDSLTQLS